MMYRSEIPFGDGYREIVPVIVHETYRLGNPDILMYISNKYNLSKTSKSLLNHYANSLVFNGLIETDIDSYTSTISVIIEELKSVLNKNIRYCLWLADKDVVVNYYGQGELSDDDIDAYYESDIILSDLGYDGVLYAYEDLPKPVKEMIILLEEK